MSAAQRGRTASRGRTARGNAAVVRQLIEEACNAGNLDVVDAVLAPDYGAPDPAMQALGGRESIKQALRLFHAAVPDARWTIVEQIAAEDTVVTRLCVHGTHRGGLWGIAPTGREASVAGVLISRFAHGQMVAHWAQADWLSLLCQLGVLPSLDLEKVVAVARVLRASEALAGQTTAQGRSTVSGA